MRKCPKNATSRHRASAWAAENRPRLLFVKKTHIYVLLYNKKGYFLMLAAEVGGDTRWNSHPEPWFGHGTTQQQPKASSEELPALLPQKGETSTTPGRVWIY